MGIELNILNAIQTIHTPVLDTIMCGYLAYRLAKGLHLGKKQVE